MTNGADTNCRTLRTDPRASEGAPGTGRRGMNGQREVSRQGIVRPTPIVVKFLDGFCVLDGKSPKAYAEKPRYIFRWWDDRELRDL